MRAPTGGSLKQIGRHSGLDPRDPGLRRFLALTRARAAERMHSGWTSERPRVTDNVLIRRPIRAGWPAPVQPGPLLGAAFAAHVAGANLPAGELRLERVAVDAERARGLADVAVHAAEHADHHL